MPRTAMIAGLMLSLGACNVTHRPKVDSKAAEAARHSSAEESVDVGTTKEKAPLGTVARKPTSGTQRLGTGETIWIQSGKSRVLQLPYKVTRVSIGNPELAGVVVLGPSTILVNAKELPKSEAAQVRGTTASRSGLLSSRTFTPPPQIEETTVILWDGSNRTDAHTVYVSEFNSEQVLLEVTVAELNRTAMEERGVDFSKISGSVRAGYWLGGGENPGPLQFIPGGTAADPVLGAPFSFVTGATRPTMAFQNGDGTITALVTMLQTEGLATVLAQPKILALSGQNAVFQVGGEIPIRIVTSFSAEIEFKAFGTLVNFLPRIADDGEIVLTVTPEVSRPTSPRPSKACPRSSRGGPRRLRSSARASRSCSAGSRRTAASRPNAVYRT